MGGGKRAFGERTGFRDGARVSGSAQHHHAASRPSSHPSRARPRIPLRGRHTTRTGRQFAPARFVQRKIAKGNNALVLNADTRIPPREGEHVGGLGHDVSAKRTDEPPGSELRIDHRRSPKSDAKPVDRGRQGKPKMAEPQLSRHLRWLQAKS